MSTDVSRRELDHVLGDAALEGFGVAGVHHLEWPCGCAAVSLPGNTRYELDVCTAHWLRFVDRQKSAS